MVVKRNKLSVSSVHKSLLLLHNYEMDLVELLVNKPSIRMYILILDTRNEEQTNDVRMYIEEYLF